MKKIFEVVVALIIGFVMLLFMLLFFYKNAKDDYESFIEVKNNIFSFFAESDIDIERCRKTIRSNFNEMHEALKKGDVATHVKFIPEELFLLNGGMENSIKRVTEDYHILKSKGLLNRMKYEIIEISDIITEVKYYTSIVTIKSIIQYEDPKITAIINSYLVAISNDKGANWKFFYYMGDKNFENLYKEMFPKLAKEIDFPEYRIDIEEGS